MQSCATWTLTISRLSDPIRVTPASFSLPRWMVTPSRMTLRSPISTRVSVPLYETSWGSPPMTAKGWTTLSSAQGRPAEDAGVGDQASAPADRDLRADDAVGPDLHVVVDLRAGVNAGRIGNQGRHDRWVPPDRVQEGCGRGRPTRPARPIRLGRLEGRHQSPAAARPSSPRSQIPPAGGRCVRRSRTGSGPRPPAGRRPWPSR